MPTIEVRVPYREVVDWQPAMPYTNSLWMDVMMANTIRSSILAEAERRGLVVSGGMLTLERDSEYDYIVGTFEFDEPLCVRVLRLVPRLPNLAWRWRGILYLIAGAVAVALAPRFL